MNEEDEEDVPNAPPRDDDVVQRHFNRELKRLESNQYNYFNFYHALPASGEGGRLTVPHATALADALMRSTSVEKLTAPIGCWPLSVFGPLLDYIRSNPMLKEVIPGYYDNENGDDEETEHSYKVQLALLYEAIAENPSIFSLVSLNPLPSPDAVYNLLANTTSLTHFDTDVDEISVEMARSINAGMRKNSSLQFVNLSTGPLDILLGNDDGMGFGGTHSSLESLQLQAEEPTATMNLRKTILKTLHCTPSLKNLSISNYFEEEDPQQHDDAMHYSSLGKIFLDLRKHPACFNLKSLTLRHFTLSATVGTPENPIEIVPVDRANSSLKKLCLKIIRFQTPNDVRLLWNIVGLQELTIESPTCSAIEPTEAAPSSAALLYETNWATFIRRNKNSLGVVCLALTTDSDQTFLRGILEGLCQLPFLTKLTIAKTGWSPGQPQIGQDGGLRLYQVLTESLSLKELIFENIQLDRACASSLVECLDHNPWLPILHFQRCGMHVHDITNILKSLFVNEELKILLFEDMRLPIIDDGNSFCQTLSQMFRCNSSLVKLMISMVDLRGRGAISEIVLGLKENTAMKSLILDNCPLDNEGMILLGRALESPDIGLEEIGLPLQTGGVDVGNVKSGTWSFLKSLAHMPTIRFVDFGHVMMKMDAKSRGLLLRAVRENKNVLTFHSVVSSTTSAAERKDMAQIEYYLKLNRFGRRLLNSPNVLPSLWPRILSPMSSQMNDVDALFFFVREYFSRQSTCNGAEQHQSPNKKARVA